VINSVFEKFKQYLLKAARVSGKLRKNLKIMCRARYSDYLGFVSLENGAILDTKKTKGEDQDIRQI